MLDRNTTDAASSLLDVCDNPGLHMPVSNSVKNVYQCKNAEVMMFYIQKVKGQVHCGIINNNNSGYSIVDTNVGCCCF